MLSLFVKKKADWAYLIKELVDNHYPSVDKIVLVMDKLNTHAGSSLYEAFQPTEAKRIMDKLEIHYTPKQLRPYVNYFTPNTTFAAQSAMIHLLLNVISPESQWTKRLYELIKSNPFIKPTRMGFSANWQDDSFWGVSPV